MKIFLFAIIIILGLVTPLATHATHAAGVELRYEYLGSNTYRFHFILFRDCAGIPVSNQYTVDGTSTCGLGSVTVFLNLDSTVIASQICNGLDDMCTDSLSSFMGIEANYYHGDVILYPCSLWTFECTPICNRNNAILNLQGGGGAWCTFIETKLNNYDFPQNSSPVFNALPLFHLCNQVQYLHLYAQDPDGDSLAFEMYTPHSDQFNDVQYVAGISATQPVSYAVPADSTQFDPLTGSIRFKADAAQVTVVAVRVNEFRNGIFIGSEERDIEVIFSSCGFNAPIATGINGDSSFSSHICADSLFSFEILTNDVDGDSVRTYWLNNIPGSSMNLSGANNQVVTFAWQPQQADISPVPYSFVLYVTDSTCPYVYYNSYTYQIYVDSCFAVTGTNDFENAFVFNASYSSIEGSILYNYGSSENSDGTLSLLDLQGRILLTDKMRNAKKFSGKIPASSLSPGIYLMEMKTSKGLTKTLKIMKN